MLAIENAEEYIKLVKEFCLYTGVQRQLDAFRGNTPCTQMIKFTHYEADRCRSVFTHVDSSLFNVLWHEHDRRFYCYGAPIWLP